MAPAGAGYITAVAFVMALVTPAQSAGPIAVLYATETQMDSVAAYEIHDDGRIAARTFQRVSVGHNPRRLLRHEKALYVATKERIEALKIDTETGCLSWFRSPGATETPLDDFKEATKDDCHDLEQPSKDAKDVIRPARVGKANFQYLAVDPQGRYLYVAAAGRDRILGYPIASDGSVSEIGSCVQGRSGASYQGLAATETKLYAAASRDGRIHVFPLSDSGAMQSFPTSATCKGGLDGGTSCTEDAQCRVSKCNLETGHCKNGQNAGNECATHEDCGDEVKKCKESPELPACSHGPDRGESCANDSDCGKDDDCPGGICPCITERVAEVFSDRCDRQSGIPIGFPETSSDYLGHPKALLLDHDTRTLYMTEVSWNRIIGCPIDEDDGSLPDCPNRKFNQGISRTTSGAEYEQIALSADGVLFASVFVNGRLRAFELKTGGLLPRKPKKRHPSSIFSTPVGLKTCGRGLYVAQGDIDRIDHFRIDDGGFLSVLPSSHTAEIEGSFPNDVGVVPLDGAGCAP